MDLSALNAATKGAVGASVDDDDLGFEGGFNDDEIDLEGFEISDGEPY